MPPQGYGAPQQPPAGYPAYPQGAYYPPPMFAYAPPREYAMPPAFPGQPWQTVPPAEGSLFQAWVSVGTRLTRQNIASWAQASKRGWTAWSIVTYLVITLLPFLALAIGGAIVGPSLIQNISTSDGQPISATTLQSIQTGFIIAAVAFVVVLPLFALASLYATTFFLALFMPTTLGTLRERMRRAIKPYALILPATGLVSMLTLVIGGVVIALVGINLHIPTTTTPSGTPAPTPFPTGFATGSLIIDAFSLTLSVYTISLFLQAGSVGTTLSRIAVFGIQLLAGFVFEIVILVVIFIVLIVVSTIVRSVSGSSMLMPLLHTTLSMLR